MASEILLVNPRRRRKTTAKRRAPTRRKRRAAPKAAKRRVRRNPAPRVTRRRRVKRNLIPRGRLGADLQTAFGGALGGLGLSVALGFLPIPVNLKAGPLGYLTKGALAFGIGFVGRNFMRASTAQRMTEGALTVVMYEALRDTVAQFAPQIPLGMYMDPPGLGYYGSGWNPGADDGMGMYLPNFSSVPNADTFDGVMGYDGENVGY
jgi:hypothetical protein